MKPRSVLVAAAVLGTGLLLTGCGLQNIASPTKEETKVYDVADKVPALRLESGSGAVVLTESGRTGFHVTETLHWKGEKPDTRHRVQGDTLRLDFTCRHKSWGCDVDYTVEVPRGLRIKVETGSGDITLRALSGELDVSTGSGVIDATGLGGKRVVAETGSGDVDLRFTGVPEDVTVRTGSGTGTVRVPDGAYHVTTDTGSGERKVEVTDDDNSSRRIIVETGSGDAEVLKI